MVASIRLSLVFFLSPTAGKVSPDTSSGRPLFAAAPTPSTEHASHGDHVALVGISARGRGL
jgi:hypothetical protein